MLSYLVYFFFFFNDTATTEIYTLSLHDALPICSSWAATGGGSSASSVSWWRASAGARSEEHTSELQSRSDLVCRLLLEKKKSAHVHHVQRPRPRAIAFRPASRAGVVNLCTSGTC